MTQDVSDVRSNPHEQIEHAVEIIGDSIRRRKVFDAICTGKKKIKTVGEIAKATGMSNKAVLEAALFLADNHIILKDRNTQGTFYKKDCYYCRNKRKILRFVMNKQALEKYPTKSRPKTTVQIHIRKVPSKMVDVKYVTIDDIDSFSKVRRIKLTGGQNQPIAEKKLKDGVKRIIGEVGKFQDWGGEKNDLFTTRLRIGGKRIRAAFGFKGKGSPEMLVPSKMGKNGDQVSRLIHSQAEVFIIQHWGQIGESIIQEMEEFAKSKSYATGKRIYIGVIDGQDTRRLILAYKNAFK